MNLEVAQLIYNVKIELLPGETQPKETTFKRIRKYFIFDTNIPDTRSPYPGFEVAYGS